jgi:hypothetical protein
MSRFSESNQLVHRDLLIGNCNGIGCILNKSSIGWSKDLHDCFRLHASLSILKHSFKVIWVIQKGQMAV